MIDDAAVRELASRGGGTVVTSLYIDVDGRRYPKPSDYEVRVQHLFRLALERARAHGAEVVAAVEGDLGRIRSFLDAGLDRTTTRGLALFSSGERGIFEPVELPVPVRDQVVVGPSPDVAQLSEILAAAEPTLVVLADHRRSRLVRVELGGVEEHETLPDDTERQVDTDVELGSFEPRHEEQLREHYRRAARAVARRVEADPVAHVVLSGAAEAVAALGRHLPERVISLVSGTLPLPVTAAQPEVVRAATELVRAAGHRRRLARAGELRERSAERSGAATGLAATLEALGEGRVTTLLVEQGFESAGDRCPRCGHLAVGDGRCPNCDAVLEAVDNVVDLAVTDAFVRHVPIEFCDVGELEDLGRIGVIERY